MAKEVKPSNNGSMPRPSREGINVISRQPSKLRRKLPRWLAWSLTIVVGTTTSAMLGATLALVTPLWSVLLPGHQRENFAGRQSLEPQSPADLWHNTDQYRLSQAVNILVMGIDPVPGVPETSPKIFAGHSDTILLLRLNPKDNSLKVLSIPRDSQVSIPGIGLTKIAFAQDRGGAVLAARVVSRTLYDVPIHRYVRISTSAFRELVNQLGGVEIFVPQRMFYKDVTQHLEINLDAGWQTLNGEQAEQFARFKEPGADGDLGRIQRQQLLIKALRNRLTNPAVLPQLSQMTHIMQNYIDTNLSLEEMLALVNFCLNIEQQNLQMVLLPGNLSHLSKDPSSYWLDPSGQGRVMREYFGASLPENVSQTQEPTKNLKIAIQNASGHPQLSQRIEKYLKDQGFGNVYTVADWTDLQRQSQIIAQQGNLEAATQLKQVLGLGSIEVAATGDLKSDLTIRVGKDWSR